jgi:hypothetical protein
MSSASLRGSRLLRYTRSARTAHDGLDDAEFTDVARQMRES